ncbi:MAG TPA: NAD(P)-dependent glycerol-3-phosphate dehydrogenase [Firmicutes bacterium]|nr:NAD(P)-dependent glycerol-3-phosphate dehydrogenase [Bacillota bacterium]
MKRRQGKKACIIGAGAWAGALGVVLCDNGYQVALWARSESTVKYFEVNKSVPRLPGIVLPRNMTVTTDVDKALSDASLVVLAIPSSALSQVTREIAGRLPGDALVVTATKGFDLDTLRRPSQVWIDANPSVKDRMCVLSGPNFAAEIAKRLPAATVVAALEESTRLAVQHAFMTGYFRVYTHVDVIGVEIGGALKNVIALACGMAQGMGAGYNAQAAIISRGIAEITRLGVALGAQPLTFAGLSGLGDLVLTSTGPLSRNRQAGIAVGKSESIHSFVDRTGYTVEGLQTVKAAMQLSATYDIPMPITDVVYRILYENLSLHRGLSEAMNRERKPEPEEYYFRIGEF